MATKRPPVGAERTKHLTNIDICAMYLCYLEHDDRPKNPNNNNRDHIVRQLSKLYIERETNFDLKKFDFFTK